MPLFSKFVLVILAAVQVVSVTSQEAPANANLLGTEQSPKLQNKVVPTGGHPHLRGLQSQEDIDALEAEIADLENLLARLGDRRARRFNRGRDTTRIDARIARVQADLDDAQAELSELLGDDMDPPVGELPVVTLVELAELAVEQGLTLDDFPETFGARSVTELLSRVSPVLNSFTDLFSSALRRQRDAIDQLRLDTAAELGVTIDNIRPSPVANAP